MSRTFETGSVRDSREGKGRYDLLPWDALFRVARRYEEGASHYGERNWELGQPISSFFDSAVRHLARYAEGEDSEDHLAAAVFNVLGMMRMEKEFDDPKIRDFGPKRVPTTKEAAPRSKYIPIVADADPVIDYP